MIPDSIINISDLVSVGHWSADAQARDYLEAQIEKRRIAMDHFVAHPWLRQFDRYRKSVWPRGFGEPDLEFADAVEPALREFADMMARMHGTIEICKQELYLRKLPN